MKNIPLTNSTETAIVDDEWYDILSSMQWRMDNSGYVIRCGNNRGGVTFMHHVILSRLESSGLLADHINRIKHDNRKQNLRYVSASHNCQNQEKTPNCSSQFIGVSWHIRKNCWIVRIQKQGISYDLGKYHDEEEAARAYDLKAVELYGKEAKLNFPECSDLIDTFIREREALKNVPS